jgi:hypothetical protein
MPGTCLVYKTQRFSSFFVTHQITTGKPQISKGSTNYGGAARTAAVPAASVGLLAPWPGGRTLALAQRWPPGGTRERPPGARTSRSTRHSRGKRQRRASEAQPSEHGRAQRGQAALAKPFPKGGGATNK